jgi:uncharacterized protein VirK/YbjX
MNDSRYVDGSKQINQMVDILQESQPLLSAKPRILIHQLESFLDPILTPYRRVGAFAKDVDVVGHTFSVRGQDQMSNSLRREAPSK